MKEALVRAGYRLDESKNAATDATIWVRVKATERSSLLKVKVNGEVMRSYEFTVTLTAAHGGRTADQHSVRFSGDAGEIDAQALGRLVPQLSGSAQFAQFCGEASKRSAEAKKSADDASASAKRALDEKAWTSAKALQCRKPVKLDACEGVDAYLIAYPNGNRVGEAHAALEEAQPHLDRLQDDENAWVRAQPGPCRRAPSRETCAGVDVYAIKFPAGLHMSEAEELLARVPATP